MSIAPIASSRRPADAGTCHPLSVPLPASMFLSHNEALGPPYRVIFDTNMFNLSISNKLEPIQAAMDCLMAKV